MLRFVLESGPLDQTKINLLATFAKIQGELTPDAKQDFTKAMQDSSVSIQKKLEGATERANALKDAKGLKDAIKNMAPAVPSFLNRHFDQQSPD